MGGKPARHLSLNLQAFCKALGGDGRRPWLWRQESFLSKIISRAQAPYHLAQNVTEISKSETVLLGVALVWGPNFTNHGLDSNFTFPRHPLKDGAWQKGHPPCPPSWCGPWHSLRPAAAHRNHRPSLLALNVEPILRSCKSFTSFQTPTVLGGRSAQHCFALLRIVASEPRNAGCHPRISNKWTSWYLTVGPLAYDGYNDVTEHLALPLPNCSSPSTVQTQLHNISRSFFDDHRARREFHWFRCSCLGWWGGVKLAETCWILLGRDELVTEVSNYWQIGLGMIFIIFHYDIMTYAILLANEWWIYVGTIS